MRPAPVPEAAGWGDGDSQRGDGFDHTEPQMPEPPPRPARPPFADEIRRPASERRLDRGDPLAGFAPEPLGGRGEPRPEGMPRMSRGEPLIPRPPRMNDGSKPTPRSERAAPPPPPPPPPAQSPPLSAADQNLAEMAQRLEAALRRPAGDTVAPPVAPEPPPARPAARNEPPTPPPAPPPTKSGFDNLEDEMASLLGRPKNPS
jgi:hypothetical protein